MSLCVMKVHCKHNPSMYFEHFGNTGSTNSGKVWSSTESLDKNGEDEF